MSYIFNIPVIIHGQFHLFKDTVFNLILFILRPLIALISMDAPFARFHCGLMVLSALRYGRRPPFHVNLSNSTGECPYLAT